MNIRNRILIPMISITVACGIAVLVTSILLFSMELNNAVYDKVNVAMKIAENEIEEIKTKAFMAAMGMANNPDLRTAFLNNDRDKLVYTANNLVDVLMVDYCTLLDSNGTVIIRTHLPDTYGDSIVELPQIKSALDGRTEAHIIKGPIVRLGISGGTPIFDDDKNMIGVVSLGFRLDTQEVSYKLKNLTGCEITLFMDNKRVSSTVVNTDGTYVLGTKAASKISETVLNGKQQYIGKMQLFEKDVLAVYSPLYGLNDEVVGMLFVGYYTSEDTKKVLTLIKYGSLITLTVLAVCILLAALIIGFIEKRLNKLLEIIQHRDDMLKSVNHAVGLLLNIDIKSFDSALFHAMGVVAESVKANRMYIWKNHPIDGELFCSQLHEWAGGAEPQQGNEFTVNVSYKNNISPEWTELLLNGKCVNCLIRDIPADKQNQFISQGILSILLAPINIEDEFWGFIGFDDCMNERAFTKEEEAILRSCGLLFANAVIRNEMEKEIAETNEYKRNLYDNAPIGITAYDEDFNLLDCNDYISKLLGVTNGHFGNFINEYSPEYQLDGMKSRDRAAEIVKNTISGENITFEWMHKSASGEHIPCEIKTTCLKHKEKMIGMGYIYDLRHVKNMESKIIQLEFEAEKIYYDSLTGIYNRRYFDDNLNKIIKSLSRSEGFLSLMMIDIDFFKKYNDTYGHSEGDKCLKKVAEALSKSMTRKEDFAARYGGEEFSVVLPHTDENGAQLVASKLLDTVRALNILHEKSDAAYYVTVSIGVITGHVNHTQKEEDYIVKADQMLYESKQKGRNRFTAGSLG